MRKHSREAIETAVRLMRDEEVPPSTRLAACEFIVERGFGKPAVMHEVAQESRPSMLTIRVVDPGGKSGLVSIDAGRRPPAPAGLAYNASEDEPDEQ